jgi:hypothetical protein
MPILTIKLMSAIQNEFISTVILELRRLFFSRAVRGLLNSEEEDEEETAVFRNVGNFSPNDTESLSASLRSYQHRYESIKSRALMVFDGVQIMIYYVL